MLRPRQILFDHIFGEFISEEQRADAQTQCAWDLLRPCSKCAVPAVVGNSAEFADAIADQGEPFLSHPSSRAASVVPFRPVRVYTDVDS